VEDNFNVFTANYKVMTANMFDGLNAGARILHLSDDGCHMTVASRYPKGVDGSLAEPYGADMDYYESFYIVKGTGRRIFADGTVVEMKEGDLIFVQPGIPVTYMYDPGFVDVAFFWSDKPLPKFLTGNVPYPPGD
jgi:mannose-6-phosphate isomerase-like protein (cupin superfamily)